MNRRADLLTVTTVAGWYPDPQTAGSLRYWDGVQWTTHVAAIAPEPAMSASYPASSQTAVPLQSPSWDYVPITAPVIADTSARSSVRRFEGPACQACGAGPARVVKFNRLRGMIILFVYSTRTGRWCRNCAVGPFRDAQDFTLGWGWWGFITFFLTPVALLLNLRQLHLARSLPIPVGRTGWELTPGKPLGERLGLWVALVLVPIILMVVVFRG